MVAEAQSLISARIPDSMAALAEVRTDDLVSTHPDALRRGRVDLVLARRLGGLRPKGSQIRTAASELIEIKRGQAAWQEIERDLVRLARLAGNLPGPSRAFLIVGCEAGNVPRKLVRDGVAVRSLGTVDGGMYRTRRVWAASPSRLRSSSVHLVALVEVFPVKAGTSVGAQRLHPARRTK